LNIELGEIIRYIKGSKRPAKVITSTNLNIKDRRVLDDFISSGIDEAIISCDGATEETYRKYRVGGDFGMVIDNLKYLVVKKDEAGSKTRIVWNFLVFKHNEHEVEKARKMAESLGVDFRIGFMRTTMKDEILKPHNEAIAKDMEWIPDNPEYSAYDKDRLVPKKTMKTCRKPWQEITVNWNGEVFPCCAVYGDSFSFGDASKEPIVKIWNNRNYLTARSEILNKNQKASTVCGLCRDNGFMHM
jgi:radical SAM protein with 4Fe4S-binding SPASM domain